MYTIRLSDGVIDLFTNEDFDNLIQSFISRTGIPRDFETKFYRNFAYAIFMDCKLINDKRKIGHLWWFKEGTTLIVNRSKKHYFFDVHGNIIFLRIDKKNRELITL